MSGGRPGAGKAGRAVSKTGFFAAAKTFDHAAIKSMLEAAPELDLVHATRPDGLAAVHIACSVKLDDAGLHEPYGIRTVDALLDGGTDIDAGVPTNEEGFKPTPVWYAAARGRNLELVRFLVGRGCDTSYSLWTAVSQDDDVLLRALLDGKPDLNLRAHGETPIFYAARLGRLKTLQVLIAARADPAIPDKSGRSAIDIARERKLPPDVVAKLAAIGKNGRAANAR